MARRPPLSVEVAEDIKKQILEEKLLPGAQLLTEAELCQRYEVSRTVVREAIVRLRSEGLLISRQGVGVFVSDKSDATRFEVDWDSIRTLPDTIALLELRLAVEVESAGLCAVNCTKADARNIRQWMEKTNLQFKGIEHTKLHYDFDFHLAIAKGTKNAHFYQLLQFLKPIIVRRIKLSAIVENESKSEFEHLIHEEHEAIVAAIEARDEKRARQNMRSHLVNSLERVRTLAASYGVQAPGKRGHKVGSLLKNFAQTIASGANN
jgi:GntR family transcriptional regulator, transcriptional repressor for pyruvate dehydrogenase complex